MNINSKQIMAKVTNCIKDKTFQEKTLRDKRVKAFKQGKTFGKAKKEGAITSLDDYNLIAQDYFNEMKNNIPSNELALLNIISDTQLKAIIENSIKDNNFTVSINFDKDSLKRKSLLYDDGYSTRYTGNGINNIIALFNNGYEIKSQTYHGRNGYVDAVPYGLWESKGVEVRARARREPLNFMQNTTNSFLEKYKELNIKEVSVNETYKK